MSKSLLVQVTALSGLAAVLFGTVSWSDSDRTTAFGQPEIQWLTWEEVTRRMEAAPRKIFVDIYTDWCGWCKVMDRNTFREPLIADYLNTHFYCVKFNAEMQDPIELHGRTYKFVPRGKRGYHELAAELTNGNLSYPTVAFLDERMQVIQPIPGYKEPDVFERIMTYFATDSYKKTPWGVYEKEYVPLKDR
jgi:thioredoxin-related protein